MKVLALTQVAFAQVTVLALANTISPASNSSIVQPPFTTPPKLKPIEQVLADNPGNSVAKLRNLALSLARDAIFGRDEMSKLSLSGRKNTCCFDDKKWNI